MDKLDFISRRNRVIAICYEFLKKFGGDSEQYKTQKKLAEGKYKVKNMGGKWIDCNKE